MPYHGFRNEYHHSRLETVELGEELDLTLSLHLLPKHNPDGPDIARLSFRDVRNFEEIQSYFNSFRDSPYVDGFMDEIVSVKKIKEKTFVIGFACNGEIIVECNRAVEI